MVKEYVNYCSIDKLVTELNDFVGNLNGYFITLDAKECIDCSQITFEDLVEKWTRRMNVYCYGRKYTKHKINRLKIIGTIENCNSSNRLHMHLVVAHDSECLRTFHEINAFARKHWYALAEAKGSIMGNLVDVQVLGDARSRFNYAFKDTNYRLNNGDFNVVMF